MDYSRKTQKAIAKYGKDNCERAFRMHEKDGEGARTIGFYLSLTTQQADAAIDAGREIASTAPVEIVARSTITPNYQWEVQTRAPAGNWVACLGTNDFAGAESQAKFQRDSLGYAVRIVDNLA